MKNFAVVAAQCDNEVLSSESEWNAREMGMKAPELLGPSTIPRLKDKEEES
jgi:hypothetical protein